MENHIRLTRSLQRLSPKEQTVVKALLARSRSIGSPRDRLQYEADITDLVYIATRRAAKSQSDLWSDSRRRRSVGARVRKEDYDRYRAAAGDRSMYRFVIDALEAEVARSVR